MQQKDFSNFLAQTFDYSIKDYCPNGLQVSGKDSINKIVTGVTACLDLIEAAYDMHADAIVVHHGLLWKNDDPVITGIKRARLARLFAHNINLYAIHLPLDIHPILGNNIQLAKLLEIETPQAIDAVSPTNLLMQGKIAPIMAEDFARFASEKLHHPVRAIGPNKKIDKLAWVTGAGQDYIIEAFQAGANAFLSGEVSERTFHLANELGISYFCAGHHATEKGGIMALGSYIQAKCGIENTFINIENPI